MRCKQIPSIEHGLDYTYRSHVGLINELMKALQKNIEIEVFGHRWKHNRTLFTHIDVHKVMSTFNVVNVEPCIGAP